MYSRSKYHALSATTTNVRRTVVHNAADKYWLATILYTGGVYNIREPNLFTQQYD